MLPRALITALAALLFSVNGLAQQSGDDMENVGPEESTEKKGKEEKDPNRGRFLVLPFVVTEPAIGEGLGAGAVYFHRKTPTEKPKIESGRNLSRTGRRGKPPPTATGVFGAYTNTETYMYGLGHTGSSPTDKYRYVGAAAAMNVNATYYLNDAPIGFNLEGKVFYLHGKRRFGESNVFIGASFGILDSDTQFAFDELPSAINDLLDFNSTDVGVALSGIYDGRDDSMMPSSGQLYDLTVWKYDEAIGGDFDYWTARFKFNTFHRLAEKFVLGFRFDVSTADGDVPFYSEPFVNLRGIPALRYTGESAGAVEVEARYDLSTRWAAVAFAGAGFTDETELSQTEDNISAYGAGVRFLALKEQNVWLGIDIARGPEDKAWYVQIGHAW